MNAWSGVAQSYRDSFAPLCAGTEPSILDDLEPGPLLDVGSGTGTLTRAALRRGFHVTAVDADPDMVAMTNDIAPGTYY
ncbi:class I SAM-dependent methyltransferase, partial [Luteococcus sp.]|uniref:class I SAM-dependent methyltransferase n=1 Tax=Luteococcus sp. TaxID=1969402 RepID=UPI003736C66F